MPTTRCTRRREPAGGLTVFVLLHQGGWDEVLYFAVPAILGFFGLRYAEKQAKEKAAALQDPSGEQAPEVVDAGDEED